MRIALVQLAPVTPLKMKHDDQMINSDGNKQEIGIVEFLTLMKKLKISPQPVFCHLEPSWHM